MANQEHLEILKRGGLAWKSWRRNHPEILPDFIGADLSGEDLSGAHLTYASLHYADLRGASLTFANLSGANLTGADLSGAELQHSYLDHTIFADLDLSGVQGLEAVNHMGPSEIGINTIYRSEGRIPKVFLLGCGVAESFIAQIPALIGAFQPIQFNSCFISYSSQDEEFAKRLHARMRQAGLRVWFAPEDMKAGKKLYEQIDSAIQVHDRLLLVLSKSSMKSKWVRTEIQRAHKTGMKEGRRKLFPIRLVSYESLRDWEYFDADEGEDLAAEVREFYIPDFSNWKNHDDFEKEFARLYASLKAES